MTAEFKQGENPKPVREVPSSVHPTEKKQKMSEREERNKLYPVNGAAFPLGVGSPQHEDNPVQVLVEP